MEIIPWILNLNVDSSLVPSGLWHPSASQKPQVLHALIVVVLQEDLQMLLMATTLKQEWRSQDPLANIMSLVALGLTPISNQKVKHSVGCSFELNSGDLKNANTSLWSSDGSLLLAMAK